MPHQKSSVMVWLDQKITALRLNDWILEPRFALRWLVMSSDTAIIWQLKGLGPVTYVLQSLIVRNLALNALSLAICRLEFRIGFLEIVFCIINTIILGGRFTSSDWFMWRLTAGTNWRVITGMTEITDSYICMFPHPQYAQIPSPFHSLKPSDAYLRQ